MKVADPLQVYAERPNIVVPSNTGVDDAAGRISGLKAGQGLARLATAVDAPTNGLVLLDTGQLAAGRKQVRVIAHVEGRFAPADNKGVILERRAADNLSTIEVLGHVQADPVSGNGYLETNATLALNERLRLITDSVAFDAGTVLLVELEVR